MEKPMFYFGSAYFWTLMFLSLTGMGFAVGIAVSAAAICGFLLIRLKRSRQGKQKLKFFLVTGTVMLVACIAFAAETVLVYQPTLSYAGEEVEGTFLVTEVLNDSSSGAHRCVLLVENGQVKGNPSHNKKLPRKLRLSSDTYTPRVGDAFKGTIQLKQLGEQDPAVARYYKSRGLYLGGTSANRIDADPLDEAAARGEVSASPLKLAWWTLRIRLTSLREKLTGAVQERLPSEEAIVLNGMFLGDKTGFSPELNRSFQRAGVLHLFAVSGFHVSLWTMLVYKALLHMGAGRKTSSGGAILFLFLFVALTGFPRSAVRAGLMLGIFFLSRLSVRGSNPLNALGVAALLLVLPNPFYAGDTGVLLSYAATLGILSWYPNLAGSLREFLKVRIPNYKLRKRVEEPLDVLLVSLCSFVFTLPIVFLTFGNVSLVTLVSNLLVSAASSLAILLTGVGAMLASVPLLKLLTPWCFLGAGSLARFMVSACRALSSLPFAYVSLSEHGFGLGLVGALLVAICGFVLYGSLPEKGLVRMTALLSVIVLLGSIFSETALNHNVIKVVFPNVEGSCVVVVNRHAAAIIGCGSDEYDTEQTLKDIFQREGVTEISTLVVPREKKTEAGALKAVRMAFSPKVELSPKQLGTSPTQTVDLWPDVKLHLYRQNGEYSAGLLEVRGVCCQLLFRPTVRVGELPEEARTAPICYLRGKRPEGLKLPTSSYIIVSGESGEVETRITKGRFRLYRR